MSSTTHEDQYGYHSNIHRDEQLYQKELMENYLVTPQIMQSIPIPEMKLSANFNKLSSFAITQIDSSNFRYFTALFSVLEEEALNSDHRIIFENLKDIGDTVFGFNGVQQEIMQQMHKIQEATKSSNHLHVITLTI